jgi:hypothetical protein
MHRPVLRWLALLPGAFLGAILWQFILHWMLYLTLVRGEMIQGVNIDPIEYATYPGVGAIGFVTMGTGIAPNHKNRVAAALAILWVLAMVGIYVVAPPDMTRISGRTVGSIAGASIGYLLSRKKEPAPAVNA